MCEELLSTRDHLTTWAFKNCVLVLNCVISSKIGDERASSLSHFPSVPPQRRGRLLSSHSVIVPKREWSRLVPCYPACFFPGVPFESQLCVTRFTTRTHESETGTNCRWTNRRSRTKPSVDCQGSSEKSLLIATQEQSLS